MHTCHTAMGGRVNQCVPQRAQRINSVPSLCRCQVQLAALPLDLLRSVSRHRALISHGREKVGGWGVRYVDDARIRGAPEPRATVVKLHLQATSEARERRVTAEKLRADK